VKVSVALTVAVGAGNVMVPLNPCELGRGNVVGPPPGVSDTVCVEVVTLQNGLSPVPNGGGFEPPPWHATSATAAANRTAPIEPRRFTN
jgi:hypothetical protein